MKKVVKMSRSDLEREVNVSASMSVNWDKITSTCFLFKYRFDNSVELFRWFLYDPYAPIPSDDDSMYIPVSLNNLKIISRLGIMSYVSKLYSKFKSNDAISSIDPVYVRIDKLVLCNAGFMI